MSLELANARLLASPIPLAKPSTLAVRSMINCPSLMATISLQSASWLQLHAPRETPRSLLSSAPRTVAAASFYHYRTGGMGKNLQAQTGDRCQTYPGWRADKLSRRHGSPSAAVSPCAATPARATASASSYRTHVLKA